ncbi:DUF2252 family protein [Kribbella kalugense]|uniref:Uncharacterized protein DUF2252 n=1 Tax=Kribbella kalugense TaxID=2512221 RepID=A0A4R7ZXE9_9ACTN|nr:DUF2252 family protein [Kribbella kalugense]TDW22396.1 uncharacterized protein DUF2252 [Kribbella kalugense]
MTVDPVAVTAAYEAWLGERIPGVPEDLELKHRTLAADPARFLRGTYYLWLERAAELVPSLFDGPQVPAVGDLHVQNFGTWLDRHRVRRWGVNDFDELAWGTPALDLVRLAVSAVLTPQVAIGPKRICRVVLDGWTQAQAGRAVDLADDGAQHLRALMPRPAADQRYFGRLAEGQPAAASDVPAHVRRAAIDSVGPDWEPSWYRRQAGVGSLGHPRFVAVGKDVAREVKLLGPPTALFEPAGGVRPDETLYERVLTTVSGPDPMRRVEGWQIRALAPDVQRITIENLRPKDTERMLTSMARAAADVHGASPEQLDAARDHVAQLPTSWLHHAAQRLTEDTKSLFHRWH